MLTIDESLSELVWREEPGCCQGAERMATVHKRGDSAMDIRNGYCAWRTLVRGSRPATRGGGCRHSLCHPREPVGPVAQLRGWGACQEARIQPRHTSCDQSQAV